MRNPTATHKVFLLDLKRPWLKILETDAGIVVCGKTTWAEIFQRGRNRRYLLGSSAFYSRKAAERAKVVILKKLAIGPVSWRAPYAYSAAVKQLQDFKDTGTVH